MDLYCSSCEKVAEAEEVDEGIGPFEFHGQRGVDVRKVWVSACCGAELLDEEGELWSPEPPESDEPEDLS